MPFFSCFQGMAGFPCLALSVFPTAFPPCPIQPIHQAYPAAQVPGLSAWHSVKEPAGLGMKI